MVETTKQSVRLDKWLWAARFFKTRRVAADAIKGGKVRVDGARAKPARSVQAGQELAITKGEQDFVVTVEGLSDQRGPAVQAETLYTETAASVERRELRREQRRANAVPYQDQRPDRRNRRQLAEFKRNRGE